MSLQSRELDELVRTFKEVAADRLALVSTWPRVVQTLCKDQEDDRVDTGAHS